MPIKKIITTTIVVFMAATVAFSQVARAEGYFTLGSAPADVRAAMGEPEEINEFEALGEVVWVYGYNSVTISSADGVTEWVNADGGLKVRMEPGPVATGSDSFSRGSLREEVIAAQGTPDILSRTEVGLKNFELLGYGKCSVKIDTKTAKVVEWDNRCGGLKVAVETGGGAAAGKGETTFSVGVKRDTLLAVQGTPDEVRIFGPLGYEAWYYGDSSVKISLRDKTVVEYYDAGNLKVAGPGAAVAELRYHQKTGNVVLYYDEHGAYKNVFSFDNGEHGTVYGVTREGVTSYFDDRMTPLNVASVVEAGDKISVVPLKETISSQWLGEFEDSLGHLELSGGVNAQGSMSVTNGMTIFDIMSDGGNYLDGVSVRADNLTFDQMSTGSGGSIEGDRIQVDGITFGSWTTPGGEVINGASISAGDDLIIHSYMGPDGTVYSGATIAIDDYVYTEFEEF